MVGDGHIFVAFVVSLGGVPFSFKETDDAKGIRFS